MDNYKQSSNFEKLAIKILEKYLNTSFDKNKTKTTKKTRDYGVDGFVFLEEEATTIIRTIEAKLRSSNYTLALKDIATSVIFFILRHGDEHYIITNVFLTSGTKDVIEAINDNNDGKIHYIDGTETKNILESIIPNLDGNELKIAKEIINEYPNLKKPKLSQKHNYFYKTNNAELYESRKHYLQMVFYELRKKTFVSLSGAFGIGKHLIAQKVIDEYKRNDYIVININALSNNLISDFCYEVTKGLFGSNINDLITVVREDNDFVCSLLNDEEISNLNVLYKIFNANCITDESSRYLVKQYLLNLFKSFTSNNYLIFIDNFDCVSKEIFNLISQISTEYNINFRFFVLTTTNSENYINLFSFEFKKIHYNTFQEIEMEELNLEESVKHIISINNSIKSIEAKKIYNYIGGNPNLIEEFVKSNKRIFSALKGNFNFYDSNTFYDLEINDKLHDDNALLLFFLVLILEEINCDEIKNLLAFKKSTNIINYALKSPLFFYKKGKIFFKSNYIKDIVEIKLIGLKTKIKQLINNYNYKPIFGDSLNQIIFYYYRDNDEIVNIYNQTKEYWNHKNNVQWNIKAIRYVCLYLNETLTDLKSVVNFCKYSNSYIEYSENTKDPMSSIIKKKIFECVQCLEDNFYNLDNELRQQISCVLFDYYVQESHRLSKIKSARLLFETERKIWFHYIDEYRKIKFIRLKALSYKSIGNRTEFYNQIDKLKEYNTPYSQFSYFANTAARYYSTNPELAYKFLSNCPFSIYDNSDLQKLQLWIENDMAIVLFYLKDLKCSRKCAETVLQKSLYTSYDENIARSYNIIALNDLENNNLNSAIENFYNSIAYSLYCNNDSILHFSVNYLNLSYNKEVESICYNYFKMNSWSLCNIFKSKTSSKRLMISLISFLDTLKKNNEAKYNELYELYSQFIEKFTEDGTEYKNNGKFYVLF